MLQPSQDGSDERAIARVAPSVPAPASASLGRAKAREASCGLGHETKRRRTSLRPSHGLLGFLPETAANDAGLPTIRPVRPYRFDPKHRPSAGVEGFEPPTRGFYGPPL